MNIVLPDKSTISIYSKTECKNCEIIKDLLLEHNMNFVEINCDQYLQTDTDKEEFFNQIKKLIPNKEKIIFPIVFNKGAIIGHYHQTVIFIKNNLEYNDDF